ncbi:MAG: type I-E CRISPR-associated protein Cse1/CasA [Verrucomicrobiae bacterium]|nr:type I-E CRISPR-associated protein Cse1/CasA [Verrucomicrobiae bacterium]
MNLVSAPWIPAVRSDGTRDLFSLDDLFAQAHTLRDLAVKPHERIALMRLLLCITQAALDGPADEEAWENCGPLIQPRVKEYLEKWRSKFELFGDGERFLQVANLMPGKSDDEGNPATKLDLSLATGNNPTLFDNAAGDPRAVAAAHAALSLLTFQCFSPGGRIGVAKWNGKDTPGKGSSNHAPCVPSSMVHTLLLGDSLLETVRLNLLTHEMIADAFTGKRGQPVWEQPPVGAGDSAAVDNATSTYLGRLVPLARCIRLQPDGTSLILANGLDFPLFPAFREATATIIQRKEELGLLPASTGRSLWRQLGPIAVRRKSARDAISGPLALMHEFRSDEVGLWIGALVTDKAKIEDVVEGFYRVPRSMLDAPSRVAYERGVHHAEETESALIQAVKQFAHELKIGSPAYDHARQHFWTRVEQSLPDLFAVARDLTLDDELPASAWGRAVQAAARDAYEQCCPCQTPRQIQAYVLGLRRLFLSAVSKSAKANKGTSHE